MLWIKSNETAMEQANGNFFKLLMPACMLLIGTNRKVADLIILFIKINVMNAFAVLQWSIGRFSSNLDMLGYVAHLRGIRMIGCVNVPIAFITIRGLTSLFGFKSTAAAPIVVRWPGLVSCNSLAGRNTKPMHCTPNNLLGCPKVFGYFLLSHSLVDIAINQFIFGKRHFVGVLVHACLACNSAYASIIPAIARMCKRKAGDALCLANN